MLIPVHKNILFVFKEEIINGKFMEKSGGGIIIGGNAHDSVRFARWGKVLAIGPEVSNEVRIGDDVLIEKLKWTEGIEYDGVQIWKTDEEYILAVEEK